MLRSPWNVGIPCLAAALMLAASPALAGKNESNNPNSPELLISEVLVTFDDAGTCDDGLDTITIRGVNFDNGDTPTVVLGNQGFLSVCSATADTIVAECPDGGSCTAGDYLLAVITGSGVRHYDDYDLTVGAVGPQGNQGVQGKVGSQGPQGKIGPQGPQGVQGPQGKLGPAGDQGPQGKMGPRGIQGPEGPAGLSGYVRVSRTSSCGALARCTRTVACPDGTSVLGGGVHGPQGGEVGINVNESWPSSSSSWRITAFNGEIFVPRDLEVWAICAVVD